MGILTIVNGKPVDLKMAVVTPLLWVLREELALTGTKFGCGIGVCGACTVLVDGVALRSCTTPIATVASKVITTIEGLADKSGQLHPLQKAWITYQVPQCGYCQSGMLMAAAALLRGNPQPTDADIAEAMTNLCRCGTYNRVREAIVAVSKQARETTK